MNELAKRLVEHIKQAGPMTVADYMGACRYDPQHGYYATRPAIGGDRADFLTAPEASPSANHRAASGVRPLRSRTSAMIDRASIRCAPCGPRRTAREGVRRWS